MRISLDECRTAMAKEGGGAVDEVKEFSVNSIAALIRNCTVTSHRRNVNP